MSDAVWNICQDFNPCTLKALKKTKHPEINCNQKELRSWLKLENMIAHVHCLKHETSPVQPTHICWQHLRNLSILQKIATKSNSWFEIGEHDYSCVEHITLSEACDKCRNEGKVKCTFVSLGTLGTSISGYLGTWPMDPSDPSSYPVPNSLLPTPFSAFCTSDATGASTPLSVCIGSTIIATFRQENSQYPLLCVHILFETWRPRNWLSLSSRFDSALLFSKWTY